MWLWFSHIMIQHNHLFIYLFCWRELIRFSASCTVSIPRLVPRHQRPSSISRASKILSTAQEQLNPARHIYTWKSARVWNKLRLEHHQIERRSEHHCFNPRSALRLKSKTMDLHIDKQRYASTIVDLSPRGYRCLRSIQVFWVKVLGGRL